MGINECTENTCRVYWLSKRTVTIERNVYFDTAPRAVEGEEELTILGTSTSAHLSIPVTTADKSSVTSVKLSPIHIATQLLANTDPDSPLLPLTPLPSPFASPPSEPLSLPDAEDEPCAKRTRKPSQQILNIINGKASTTALPRGVQPPNPVVEEPAPRSTIFEGDGVAEQMLTVTDDRYEHDCDEHELTMLVKQASTAAEVLEPTTLADTRRRPDWPRWEGGIHEELDTLEKAGTWELVDPPPNANIVGSKWVFCAKKDAAGNIVCYKACLVAQGFFQVPGIDYFNMYAPVAKLASIWTILTYAACQNLELHQIDIKGTYLNGKLNESEVIYMC